FAVFQVKRIVRLDTLVRGIFEDAVVENLAILIDLNERRALVSGGTAQGLRKVAHIDVHRPRHKGGLGADGQGKRPQRIVDRAEWTGFDARSRPRGGRILPFGETIDFVIEENDLHVQVTADGMDQVVAADGEAVAVARDDPYLQIGPADLQSRRKGRGTPVDTVKAVGVHVVRKTAGAADSGDEHHLLAWEA